MTKDEMINQKIVEQMKETFPNMYAYCRKKVTEEIKTELRITKKQKKRLTDVLNAISKATGHKYSTLTYVNDDPFDKKVFLGFYSTEIGNAEEGILKKTWHYDMISGTFVSFVDDIFVSHQEYKIDDLIEE